MVENLKKTIMIKANELRIGNLINQVDVYGDLPINAYNIYQYEVYEAGGIVAEYYKEWKAIPLTEEWLLKFGFEKDDTMFNIGKIQLNKTTIHFQLYLRGINEKGNVSKVDVNILVKTVHQLQNLYFALTGSELTYKL